jgi:hypothetical protein
MAISPQLTRSGSPPKSVGLGADAVGAVPDELLAVLTGIVETELARVGRGIMKKVARCLESRAKHGENTSAKLSRIEEKVDEMTRRQAKQLVSAHAPAPAPLSEEEASQVFAFLLALESEDKDKHGRLYDVFVLTVLKKCSQRVAAKRCGCSLGTLSTRVGELEARFGLPLKRMQASASRILEMMTSVKGERQRKRKPGSGPGAFSDEEPDDDGEDRAPQEEYRYEADGPAD